MAGGIELPLAVGVVGGVVNAHPTAKFALQILGVKSAKELATVMAAVGLAQNLAGNKSTILRGHSSWPHEAARKEIQ